MPSGISKRFCRHVSQEVCPWNVRFARELAAGSRYTAREALGARDARTLARQLSGMTPAAFSDAFRGSDDAGVGALPAADRFTT